MSFNITIGSDQYNELVTKFNDDNKQDADEINQLVSQIKAASAKSLGKRELFRKAQEDSAFEDFFTKLQKLKDTTERLEAEILNEAKIKFEAPDNGTDIEAVKEQLKPVSARFSKSRRDALQSFEIVGRRDEAETDLVTANSIRGVGGKTSGPRGKSPRLDNVEVDGEELEKATFTALSQRVNVPGKDLKAKAFEVAGTDDLSTVNDTIEFTVGDHNVSVTPKGVSESVSENEESDWED